ncbi:MAG: Lrp/AsnC family transcriptional regulator [Gammaproteobacteria bacterium]
MKTSDRRLLRELQNDSQISNQTLADRAGLSPSACWRRVKALEEAGVIDRHVVILNAGKAGLNFSAIVHVTLTRHDVSHVEHFISRVVERDEVLECLSTTGESDYHLRVVCQDKDAYNRFLDGFLFQLPGVAQIRTNLVLKEIKLKTALPL